MSRLKLKLKRGDGVLIDAGEQQIGVIVCGYKDGGYSLVFVADPKVKIKIVKPENSENNKEKSNE